MAILSANFIILSALVNNTFFINRPPGVTKAYMYLYPDVAEEDDSGLQPNSGYWIELQKNIRYGGASVFQANISDYIVNLNKCDSAETISYKIRLVFYNDIRNYGDSPTINKILIPKKRGGGCTSTPSFVYTENLSHTSSSSSSSTTEMNSNFTEIFPSTIEVDLPVNCSIQVPVVTANYNTSSAEIFSCTLTNLLLFSISFNSCFMGILYVALKLGLHFYYKLKTLALN